MPIRSRDERRIAAGGLAITQTISQTELGYAFGIRTGNHAMSDPSLKKTRTRLSRRAFLAVAASAVVLAVLAGCPARTPPPTPTPTRTPRALGPTGTATPPPIATAAFASPLSTPEPSETPTVSAPATPTASAPSTRDRLARAHRDADPTGDAVPARPGVQARPFCLAQRPAHLRPVAHRQRGGR